MLRDFTPKLGQRLKLKTFELYHKVPKELVGTEWAWLIVEGVTEKDGESLSTVRDHEKTPDITNMFVVPTIWLAPPLSWRAEYTIYFNELERANHFIDGINRGVEVYTSMDMSGPQSYMFRLAPLPGTDPAPVNWNYTHGYIETLNEAECKKHLTIELQTVNEVSIPPTSCKSERSKAVRAIRKQYELTWLPPGCSYMKYVVRTKLWPLTD